MHDPIDYLLRSAKEPAAFGDFYRLLADDLTRFEIRRVYDVDVALDLVGETFATAFFVRKRFRGTTNGEAKAWLYGVAVRTTAMYFRKSKVERRALKRLGIEPPTVTDVEAERLMEKAELGPMRAEVQASLDSLSPAQRVAVELRIVQELPYTQVAHRLGVTEEAARARVARGLKVLAAALPTYLTLEGEAL
jgi:RNA polymerase sigma-70 factor (ECF subfamily)